MPLPVVSTKRVLPSGVPKVSVVPRVPSDMHIEKEKHYYSLIVVQKLITFLPPGQLGADEYE
jgi:hypothetical protein